MTLETMAKKMIFTGLRFLRERIVGQWNGGISKDCRIFLNRDCVARWWDAVLGNFAEQVGALKLPSKLTILPSIPDFFCFSICTGRSFSKVVSWSLSPFLFSKECQLSLKTEIMLEAGGLFCSVEDPHLTLKQKQKQADGTSDQGFWMYCLYW